MNTTESIEYFYSIQLQKDYETDFTCSILVNNFDKHTIDEINTYTVPQIQKESIPNLLYKIIRKRLYSNCKLNQSLSFSSNDSDFYDDISIPEIEPTPLSTLIQSGLKPNTAEAFLSIIYKEKPPGNFEYDNHLAIFIYSFFPKRTKQNPWPQLLSDCFKNILGPKPFPKILFVSSKYNSHPYKL